jgi:hypothetical protein
VTAQVEYRWRDRLGAGTFDRLRAALAAVADRLDPLLPDCLPILGYGLFARRDRGGKEAAGPVLATLPVDYPSAGELPLWALLSRPLRAFAEQYEAEPGPSLAISANVLRVLTEAGVRTRDIPALGGVSKESVAMAMGVSGAVHPPALPDDPAPWWLSRRQLATGPCAPPPAPDAASQVWGRPAPG